MEDNLVQIRVNCSGLQLVIGYNVIRMQAQARGVRSCLGTTASRKWEALQCPSLKAQVL